MSRKRLVNQGMMMTSHFDPISPSHYKQGSVECIEALASATANLKGIEAVCTANAIKYLWRWKEKNGVEDLQKAQWYIDKLIEIVQPQSLQPPEPDESNL
jgi:hypothetical protein